MTPAAPSVAAPQTHPVPGANATNPINPPSQPGILGLESLGKGMRPPNWNLASPPLRRLAARRFEAPPRTHARHTIEQFMPARSLAPRAPEGDRWSGAETIEPAPGLHAGGDERAGSAPDSTGACTDDRIRRLLDRATFGYSWSDLGYARSQGYNAWLEAQLNPAGIDDSELDARLAAFKTLFETPRQIVLRAWSGDYTHTEELFKATVLRAATSNRQLLERMTEFWGDHFNIYLYKDGCETFKPIDDRDVIRTHSLGTFPDLLRASARSPAMLTYLDNAFSFWWSPNQNYARELLELHTLGVENYTQSDIEEIARCFTGWTIDYDFNSPSLGRFRFEPDWHDNGAKNVLGHKIPGGGGESDGDAVINILCYAHDVAPITARFVGRKLAVRFWGENPPTPLVDAIAGAFLATGGDIKSMLRVVLGERWQACAPRKLKRPFHLAMSTLRAMPTFIFDYWYLIYILDIMGQAPFLWAPPNGYPEAAAYWSGHILPRWRFGFYLLQEQGEIAVDILSIINAGDSNAMVEEISRVLFAGAMPRFDRRRLLKFLGPGPGSYERVIDTIGLAIASPSFQMH